MARPVRIEFEGAVYHAMARGNERRDIFRSDDDRKEFLKLLSEARAQFGILIHAYCLMPNHYHLLLETPRANLSRALGWLQLTYTVRFNRRHRRVGHLFQGRYKAQLVDAEAYARSLLRYIHLNPVRPRDKQAAIPAERAVELDAYLWSSHRDYAALRRPLPWLCLDWLGFFGKKGDAAHREYRAFVRHAFETAVENPWVSLRQGIVLGSDALQRKAQTLLRQKEGRDERRLVQGQTAKEIQARLRQLLADEKDERIRIWARVRLGSERGVDVGREYGYKDGSGVTQLIKRLENEITDDKRLRAKLDALQQKMSSVKS